MFEVERVFTPEWCKEAFPPERTDEFFEALFGDPEDGAYTIEFAFDGAEQGLLKFVFNLHQRGNSCLACNLTYGLPKVFDRHPIINAGGLAARIAGEAEAKLLRWEIGATVEHSRKLHAVPMYVWIE